LYILVLSACDDDHFIKEMLQVGADAYLTKGEKPEKIRQAVSSVSRKISMPVFV